MNSARVFRASAVLELAQLRRGRTFVLLTALAAVSFLVMVSLFGLTGAYAPVALIDCDGGPHAKRLVQALVDGYHSFALKYMPSKRPKRRCRLVAWSESSRFPPVSAPRSTPVQPSRWMFGSTTSTST